MTAGEGSAADTAFYCVADSRYFLGAVAMINSLRLQGHDELVHLLDCGLEPEQRRLLEPHAEVVSAPDDTPPYLLKTILPLRRPAGVMVLVDVDIIATRRLDELFEHARGGRVVAFENLEDRFFAEWGELLDLGPIERRRYLCSGFVAMARDPGDEVLRVMDDRQRRADITRNCFTVDLLNEPFAELPFLSADQDVLNAVLAARVDADRVVGLETRLATLPPFDGLRLLDERSLRCAFGDGVEPYMLHHIFPGKPWMQPMPPGLYTDLLQRLLLDADVAIRVPAQRVPMRLRRGARADLVRRREQATLRARLWLGLWSARARAAGRALVRRGAPAP